MMIIADLVVVAIIAVFAFIGIKRGFIRSCIGLCSVIISLFISIWAYPIVTDFINNTSLNETIASTVELGLEDKSDSASENDDSGIFSILPDSAQDAIESGTEVVADSARKATAQAISTLAINIISILIVFIVVRIIMFLLSLTLGFITKLPVIKSINKLLGAIFGALCGILVVYLLLALLAFTSAINTDNPIGKSVKESYIASQMYDNNFIIECISGK